MDLMWIVEHPAEAAWAVFGALTVAVATYRRYEDKLKRFVDKTETEVDNKILRGVAKTTDALSLVLEIASEFAPHAAAKKKFHAE